MLKEFAVKFQQLISPCGKKVQVSGSERLGAFENPGFRCWVSSSLSGSVVVTTASAGTARQAPDVELVAQANRQNAEILALRTRRTSPKTPQNIASEGEVTMFVYQAPNFEFHTTQPGRATLDQFDAFLSEFTISDSDTGLILESGRSSRNVETQLLVGEVPDTAILTSYFAPSGADRPQGRGKQVRGGELWGIDGETSAVLLGGETTVTEITPVDEAVVDDDFIELAENIKVEAS